MTYSAGILTRPDFAHDERFDTYEQAESAAIEGSFDDGVWAVWDDEPGSVEAVIYQQSVYT